MITIKSNIMTRNSLWLSIFVPLFVAQHDNMQAGAEAHKTRNKALCAKPINNDITWAFCRDKHVPQLPEDQVEHVFNR